MGRRSGFVKYVCICILICSVITVSQPDGERVDAFTSQVIQKGATGLNVVELQARLQYIGYYRGQIDGVFGWGTYWALRNFQQNYGLKVDGLAGLKTRQKLVSVSKYDEQWVRKQIQQGNKFTYYGGVPKSSQTAPSKKGVKPGGQTGGKTAGQTGGGKVVSPAENLPQGFSQSDKKLMVRMVYAEAKGEPYVGKVAVAAVILNRVDSSKFPNTIPGVIYEPQAFTSVANGELWVGQPKSGSKKAVVDALNGWDPSGGALYYFNPVKATSDWIWSRPQIKKIGEHIFTK